MKRLPLASSCFFAVLIGVFALLVPATGLAQGSRPNQLLTEADDERAGQEAAREVAAQIGILEDPELNAYLQQLGVKLLRGLPRRPFRYRFYVVDQAEPNAFALPGGFIFVSRGLLALATNEDELANVIGHEITHSAMRHSARQQSIAANLSPLLMGIRREAKLRGYSRDMEREADEGGQQLAAAAGYDPRGMATFMDKLSDWERLGTGVYRRASFFDTHPTSTQRASVNRIRASEMRWTPAHDPSVTKQGYIKRLEGLPVGERPEAGIFSGARFLHPDLDFQVRFPNGWRLQNSGMAVGASAPRGGAVVFLTADSPQGPPRTAAQAFLNQNRELRVQESNPTRIFGQDAWEVKAIVSGGGGRNDVFLTFLPHRGSTWRFTGITASALVARFEPKITRTIKSFRPLNPDQLATIHGTKLRIVKAEPGEDINAFSKRTGNGWGRPETAIANGLKRETVFEGGELVKIIRSEPYARAQ